MSDYFIDPTWSGAKNGTEAAPYSSVSQLPSRVAGDRVFFRAGTVHVGQLIHSAANAAATTLASPITYGRYGEGADPVIRSAAWCIDISQPGIVVQDIRVGAVSSYSDGGVRVLDSGEARIQRVTVEDRCTYGVRIDNTTAALLRNIDVLDCDILGTFGETGILVIWGSALGGIFEDVKVLRNRVRRTGVHATVLTNTPYGIRFLPRITTLTESGGGVERALFSRGVQCDANTIRDTCAYGICYSGISSGGTETLRNRITQNTLRNIGDGRYDSHMLWVGGARDVLVAANQCDGSIMYQGSSFGTGVGIFIDNMGFNDLFNNSKRVVVRGNRVRNTGLKSDGSLGDMEVAGAGILTYLSQDVLVVDNAVTDCHNGIGTLGWFGSGGKTTNVEVRGNRIRNIARDAISTIKGAANVLVQENWVHLYGGSGIYVEDSGSYAVANYGEVRNSVSGGAAFMGGSFPSSAVQTAPRVPAVGNLLVGRPY